MIGKRQLNPRSCSTFLIQLLLKAPRSPSLPKVGVVPTSLRCQRKAVLSKYDSGSRRAPDRWLSRFRSGCNTWRWLLLLWAYRQRASSFGQWLIPKRFRRSRDYGFLHSNAKKRLFLVQLLLNVIISPIKAIIRPVFKCRACGESMKHIAFRVMKPT